MNLVGPVEIVGAGLLGTSVALACQRRGLEVLLSDTTASHVKIASSLGAGRPRASEDQPQLVVVAVPPDHLGAAIVAALRDNPEAVVTDVGSVKGVPLREVQAALGPAGARRYVGSHPMAGSERSGPLAASPTLFDGRPWAVAAHEGSDPAAVDLVRELAELCGGVVVALDPASHDAAVARTSHLPHLASVLVAGRLAGADSAHLELSGQGVRDVTRIARSDPALWEQIISANAGSVTKLLRELRDSLDTLLTAVDNGQRDVLREVLAAGVRGTQAIPGKHGGPARPMETLFVSIPDAPGALGRLFGDVGESGLNIEDVRIDHDHGREGGLVELTVDQASLVLMLNMLESKGWDCHR